MHQLTWSVNTFWGFYECWLDENNYKCITGEEGPSLMGLEDMAMFRALPTATIFYPSDGVSTEKAVELAATTKVRKTEVQRCGFPTASVEHVFITKNSLFAVCWLSCSPTQRVFATSEPAAKTVPSSITATRTSMLDRLRWDSVFTCIAVKTESKKYRKLLLQHEHTDHCQHCDLKQKIMHLPLPGGVPGERGPGDCGGSRSDFARGPGSSWTFKERCTTLPSDHREEGILHLFKYMTSS